MSGRHGDRPMNTSERYRWHYTNREGIEGIVNSGKLRPSTNVTHDAVLGKGVYMTDISPANRKADILENNYGADPGRHKMDK